MAVHSREQTQWQESQCYNKNIVFSEQKEDLIYPKL